MYMYTSISTDRYINSAASRRGDSRARIDEYTVTTQRAANCKASATVMRASQIMNGNETSPGTRDPSLRGLRSFAQSLVDSPGFASSRARTWPRACAQRSCVDYSRVRVTLFSLAFRTDVKP